MFVDKLELEILGILTLRSGSWGFLVLRPGLFEGIEVANLGSNATEGASYILSQCSAITNVKNTIEQRTTNAIGKEAFVRLIGLTRVN